MGTSLDERVLRQLLGVTDEATPPATPFTTAARYFTSLEGFDVRLPRIPPHVFRPERDRALDPAAPTGLIPLDLSTVLGTDGPATTPLILARYARIRGGERLESRFAASGQIYYVMRGRGRTVLGDDRLPPLAWGPGDVFCLPGGGPVRHEADVDALLWVVTNEPQLAFERCRPPDPADLPFRPVHYPAAEIRRRLLAVHLDPRGPAMPGKSVNLGNAALEHRRTTTPSFTLAMNSLLPGESQRAHRHNAVAVTLVVAGEGCCSVIEGTRVAWEPDAVMITPPGDLHSHHNEGRRVGLFLIVQDGGLYYHCRTMGFSYR